MIWFYASCLSLSSMLTGVAVATGNNLLWFVSTIGVLFSLLGLERRTR